MKLWQKFPIFWQLFSNLQQIKKISKIFHFCLVDTQCKKLPNKRKMTIGIDKTFAV